MCYNEFVHYRRINVHTRTYYGGRNMQYRKRIVTLLMALAMLVSLVLPAAAENYEAITPDQEKNISVSSGNPLIFSFTPTQEGHYSFWSTNYVGDPKAAVYDSTMTQLDYDDDGGPDWNFEIRWYAEAGQTYYLEAKGYGSYIAQVSKLVAPTAIELSQSSVSGYADEERWYSLDYSFTPQNAFYEAVTFSSSNENVVTLNQYGEYCLRSEGTAVITATSESGLTAVCSVTVRGIQSIVCDQPVTANEEDNEYRFRFVPQTSDWYGFYSVGSQLDTWGYIYDAEGHQLDYDDSSAEGNNFLACAWLEAGNTYTLHAGWYNNNNGRATQLQVTALSAPQALDLSSSSMSLYASQSSRLYCSFIPTLSIPESLTWSSSDEKVATVDEDGYVTVHDSGTAVITVTSDSGLTAACTVTGKVAPLVTCDDTITVLYNTDTLYKFIPDTDGWYGFYSTGTDGDPYGCILDQWFNNLSYNANNGVDKNFLVKAYLEAGETYYLEPRWNSSSSDSTYEARIVPLPAATGLTLSHQTLTKQIGTTISMQAHTVPLLSVVGELTWSSSNESVAAVNEYGEINCLALGTAVITVTSEDGLQASCTLTVAAVPSISLNTVVDMDVAMGEYRHRFTAPREGWYAFESLNNTIDTYGTLYQEDGRYIEGNDDSGNGSNFRIFYYMEAGESCILSSKALNDNVTEGTYQIQVTAPPEATGVQLHYENRNGFVGENSWNGATVVPDNAVPQSMTWSSSDEAVVRVTQYGDLYYVGAGTAVITVTTEKGLTASFPVTVKTVQPIQNNSSVTLQAEDGKYRFEFIPTTTGIYRFYSTGAPTYLSAGLSSSVDLEYTSDRNGNDFNIYAYLIERAVYQLYVEPNLGATGNYDIHLEKAVDATGIQLSQTAITGEPGDRFDITATLTPGNAAPQALSWQTSNDDVAYVSGGSEIVLCGEGSAIITVTTSSGLTASCQVTSAYKVPTPIQSDRPATVSAADGTSWFSFVPQTSGWYRFFSSGTGADPYGGFCDADRNGISTDDDNGNDRNFSAECELVAGQTYYLWVNFYGSDTSKSCTVELEKMTPATGISLSSTQLSGYEGDTKYLYVDLEPEFAVPETITWTSSNQQVVTVDEDGMLTLHKTGTAVITATSERGLKATCTVTVKNITELSLNQVQTLDASQGSYKFKFTPKTSGWYGFYTTGDVDTWGELTDNAEHYWGDDDDGEDLNYMIRCQLEAGKTYYLYSSYYDGEVAGTFTLRVVTLTKPTGLQLEYEQLITYPDWNYYVDYSFYPMTAYYEPLTWSSSNSNVVTVNQDGEITTVAPGTARITATSESGLTSRLTVVVAEPPADADDYGHCGPNLLWYRRGDLLTITGTGKMYHEPWFSYGFTQIQFPEGMTTIGSYAFPEMELQGIVFPSTLNEINFGAFMYSSIPSIRFLGNAPAISDGAFKDVTTTAYYPAGNPTWTEEVRRDYGGNITWVAYDPGTAAGAAVSGSITTGATGNTTVELLLNGTVACTATVSGKTGNYSFSDLLPGDYTLRVSKANHVTREYAITVGSYDVTQNVNIHLIGDINGDGRVNVGDVAKIYAHAKKTTYLTDAYEIACADVTGDNRINVGDAAKVYAHAKKTTPLF